MNRPSQPQQRPPSLAPNPSLTGQFRPPYPTYGMPPRNVNVLQGGFVPSLQPNVNHRTAVQQQTQQGIIPQPSPGFMQQRAQNSFAFGGSLGQHQQQQSTPLQQQPPVSQQQANGTSSNSLPPHLSQTPSLGATAPSVSSASEVGLDPNDFPALGSTPANSSSNPSNLSNNGGITTSYANQVGTGVGPLSGSGTSGVGGASSGSANQPRDFTPDDFPALGVQTQTQPASSQSQHPPNANQSQDANHSHPPGLNGFQSPDPSQQHRQNLLGSLGGGIQQNTPGMLNLGPAQARSVLSGFGQESEKQRNNYALKLNQATHAAWNSTSPNSQTQPAGGISLNSAYSAVAPSGASQQNGTHSNQNSSNAPQQPPHLNAPPGVPPLSAGSYAAHQQQQTHNPGAANNNTIGNAAAASTPYPSNGLSSTDPHTSSSLNQANNAQTPNPNPSIPNPSQTNPNSVHLNSTHHPQTPAQQILMSAADRWGLLGLLAMIKNAGSDVDQGLSSVGTDLGTMGLDMGYPGNLYSTFITPWADQSAAHTVEPDFHLPACYAVPTPPPGPSKATAFSDETLFFMFYSSPRDALQEIAAQELWNRNWRYHKELRIWITKESGSAPSQKVPGGEQGQYTYWDPENWGKERKEMTVMYADLEEKTVPAFLQGPGLILAQPAAVAGQQGVIGQNQQQAQIGQMQQTQRSAYPMSLAGM